MGGIISILALLGYLFLLVDWKEMRKVLADGGWAACTIYAVVALLVIAAIQCPACGPATGGHHG